MLRHLRKVKLLHPPGTEIYRNGNISMFEVRTNKHRESAGASKCCGMLDRWEEGDRGETVGPCGQRCRQLGRGSAPTPAHAVLPLPCLPAPPPPLQVDGRKAKTFCQNLCYLAKLFLDHK